VPNYQSYIICTTPRSGSTLLCKMLAATDCAGVPESHFHVPSVERWLAAYRLDGSAFASRRDALAAIFQAAIVRGKGTTNLFGLRMQRGSFEYFARQLEALVPGGMSDVERIEAVFGRTLFIHLSRPDRLDQAISRLRAEQTGLWHLRSDGTELERRAPHKAERFDAPAIALQMKELAELDDAWIRWFDQEAIEPLKISYPELSNDPQTELSRVLTALGLNPVLAEGVEVPTAKLADAESLIWRERFLSER